MKRKDELKSNELLVNLTIKTKPENSGFN